MSLHEDFTAKLAKIRGQIATTQAELAQADVAPVPLEVALSRADAQIEALQASYQPPVAEFTERGYRGLELIHPDAHDLGREVVQFIVWTAPAKLRERLHSAIKAHYADLPEGVTDVARTKRKAELRTDLFRLEVGEEKLIMAAAAEGLQLDRRADVNPEALLEA